MQPTPANSRSPRMPRRTSWRVAALAAASTVALAACGAAAAGTGSTPATPASTASSTPAAPSTGPTAAGRAEVGIINFTFTPAALTIKLGTTVVWTNKDAIAHTVDFMTGNINSKVLNRNDQFTYTFTTPGTYNYICSIHPFMHGSVTVTT
jgi:amicyanin